jgi:hypothetical protein
MARPKGKKRHPVNLTLPPSIARNAARLAFHKNESLSQLVGRLLEDYIRQTDERKAA